MTNENPYESSAPSPDLHAPSQDRGSVVYVTLLALVAALGGLLFGYDTAVIAGAIGFLQEYFQLDPQVWTGWAAASALVGCAVGAAFAGTLSDHFGRKTTLIVSAVLFLVSAVGTAVPRTFYEFVVYRIIGGFGVGAASLTSPMYIAEVSPARIRGRMVSVNQFAIVSGMLLVYFVNYFIAAYGDSVGEVVSGSTTAPWNVLYGWRWMFGSEALPAVMLLVLMFCVPESPRWLTKQKRRDRAMHILTRIGGAEHARFELAEIESAIAQESSSLGQLFVPGMRLALAIGIVLAVLQQVTGINVFLYYGPEIFKKMGTQTNAALLQTVVVGAVNLTFTVVAIWTVDRLGRKPLMLIGYTGMGISLVGMGLAAYWQQTQLWVLAFVLGYIACFALSVGPVTWVILSEIFPTSIRGRAMAIATVCLWMANFVVTQTFTMMDGDAWLVATFHHGFPFWIYGALCAASVAFVALYVPETKGKTLEEIERGWLRGK